MSLITLAEFQRICSLSDAALCWLLRHNRLVCHYDNVKGLLVDSRAAQTKDLVEAIAAFKKEFLAGGADKSTHRFSRLLVDKISELVDGALEKALARPRCRINDKRS